MTIAPPSKPRPLSPHLGIYKPQISSIMSILHRISGVGLALGMLFLVLWIVVLAGEQASYVLFMRKFPTLLGQCTVYGLVFGILWINLNGIVLGAASKSQNFAKGVLAFVVLIIATNLTYLLYRYIGYKIPVFSAKAFPYLGTAVLFGWTWAFFYHFCCGIRHLLWDAGCFLTLKGMHVTGWITLLISTAATLVIWLKIWGYIP